MSTERAAENFLQAFVEGDRSQLAGLVGEEATLRSATSDGLARSSGREHVIDALFEIRAPWHPDTLELISVVASDQSGALQFRVQSREGDVVVEAPGAVFLRWAAGAIVEIDLYLPQPIVAAARDEIIRGSLSEAERMNVARMLEHRQDYRDPIPPRSRLWHRRSVSLAWSEVAEPGSNSVNWARWPAEEADERIEEIIEAHRRLGIGFNWTVGPFDSPTDLSERLLRHGLLRAGDVAMMLKFGLHDLDTIPTNSEIDVVELNGRRDLWEASLQLAAKAFYWPPERTENERDGWFAEIAQPNTRAFIALLHGQPVGSGHLFLQAGVAYLGGASTLAEVRGRKIYSTILRRRLECAQDAGYDVAMTYAEPMSRRVVSRFGFLNYATYDVFGWMEPMDPEVISRLVVDE